MIYSFKLLIVTKFTKGHPMILLDSYFIVKLMIMPYVAYSMNFNIVYTILKIISEISNITKKKIISKIIIIIIT